MPDVQRLLALANGAALHKALRDAGYPAKYRTVARWVQTRQVPADMEAAVLEAFGLGQQGAAPPWWGEAASDLVAQIEERMSAIAASAVARQQDDLAARFAQQLADELGLSARPAGEAPPAESAEPRDAAHRAAQRRP